jgi:hypothetical protein
MSWDLTMADTGVDHQRSHGGSTGQAVTHHRLRHRLLNIGKGRALARLGVWRPLWR